MQTSEAPLHHIRGGRVLTIVAACCCLALLLASCGSDPPAASRGGVASGQGGAPTTAAPVGMAAPAGYASSQLIFDDQFAGTRLDSTKWNTYIGAEGQRWDNNGTLPYPYSGPNTPITDEAAMFGPSQVGVHDGLTLTATRNTNQFSSLYPWISGVVTTEGKFTLPFTGWYVQVKAQMPDQTQGMWPAIWFLPGVSGTPINEFDGYEGGWIGTDPNQIMHSDYFSNQGQRQQAYDVGTDLTAGYHVYGFQYLPNKSVTAYVDGRQVWQVSTSQGVAITPEPYQIIVQLQVAASQATSHTQPSATTPPASMRVAEVQAYSSFGR